MLESTLTKGNILLVDDLNENLQLLSDLLFIRLKLRAVIAFSKLRLMHSNQ